METWYKSYSAIWTICRHMCSVVSYVNIRFILWNMVPYFNISFHNMQYCVISQHIVHIAIWFGMLTYGFVTRNIVRHMVHIRQYQSIRIHFILIAQYSCWRIKLSDVHIFVNWAFSENWVWTFPEKVIFPYYRGYAVNSPCCKNVKKWTLKEHG